MEVIESATYQVLDFLSTSNIIQDIYELMLLIFVITGTPNLYVCFYLTFFRFIESENNPAKDPLIFYFGWFLGTSSLPGLLKSTGPYRVNADGKTLDQNSYSWNKFASIVYIEETAGLGYSYASDGNVTTDFNLVSFFH